MLLPWLAFAITTVIGLLLGCCCLLWEQLTRERAEHAEAHRPLPQPPWLLSDQGP